MKEKRTRQMIGVKNQSEKQKEQTTKKKIDVSAGREAFLIHFGFNAVTKTNVEVLDGTTWNVQALMLSKKILPIWTLSAITAVVLKKRIRRVNLLKRGSSQIDIFKLCT